MHSDAGALSLPACAFTAQHLERKAPQSVCMLLTTRVFLSLSRSPAGVVLSLFFSLDRLLLGAFPVSCVPLTFYCCCCVRNRVSPSALRVIALT